MQTRNVVNVPFQTILTVTLLACSLTVSPLNLRHAVAVDHGGKPRHPFTVERNVVYSDDDGETRLSADIYLPTAAEESRPAVLMIHGGAWMSGNKLNVAAHAMKLARAGYVVMAINYRLAPKYKFPAQLEDCEQAVRWLASNSEKYRIDTSRLATYGYSAGGHLACLLGLKSAEVPRKANGEEAVRLRAIVAGGAPCEFRSIPKESRSLSYWLGGTRGEFPDRYHAASPTAFVSKAAPPVFIFHGDKDKLVPMQGAASLRELLQKQGTSVEMRIVEDRGHLGAFFDGASMNAAREFLDLHLKPSSPSLNKDRARLPERP